MLEKIVVKNKSSSNQCIKVEPFRKNIRKTSPHKHNAYLELVFLTKGDGIHGIDFKEYKIQPPQLFIINKEQVHFWDISSEPEGYVLIIKPVSLENHLRSDLIYSIQQLTAFDELQFKNIETLTSLFMLLEKEVKLRENFKLINALLYALLEAILFNGTKEASPLSPSLFQKFISEIEKHNFQYTSIKVLAEAFHTTPQNLNIICRKEIQKSASDLLANLVLNEAKRQLIYTSKSSAKIAADLNFSDASHFSKYFKKHTGSTPNQFRLDMTAL